MAIEIFRSLEIFVHILFRWLSHAFELFWPKLTGTKWSYRAFGSFFSIKVCTGIYLRIYSNPVGCIILFGNLPRLVYIFVNTSIGFVVKIMNAHIVQRAAFL